MLLVGLVRLSAESMTLFNKHLMEALKQIYLFPCRRVPLVNSIILVAFFFSLVHCPRITPTNFPTRIIVFLALAINLSATGEQKKNVFIGNKTNRIIEFIGGRVVTKNFGAVPILGNLGVKSGGKTFFKEYYTVACPAVDDNRRLKIYGM